MQVKNHPDTFKTGTRVLMLKGRHKDKIKDERTVTRITHGMEQFDKALAELAAKSRKDERIYASAGARDVPRAIRIFKERQLAADYDAAPSRFYTNIEARWVSCLQNPLCQAKKFWLFDCDSDVERSRVEDILKHYYRFDHPAPYSYSSKSGWHILTAPFNLGEFRDGICSMLHKNPIMLWAY